MRRRLDDGSRALRRVGGLENTGAHEHRFGAEHAAERRVRGCRDAAGGEVRNGEPPVGGDPRDELERSPEILRRRHPLVLREERERLDLPRDFAKVLHRVDDVARAGLALRPDHRRSLADAPERLAEIPAPAHERHLVVVLVDVVLFVGRREHLGFVDEIHLEGFEDPRFGEVADAAFRHHGDRHGRLDRTNLRDGRHARDPAFAADVGRNALERHHGGGARVLGDLGLLGIDDVHDDAALEHLGEADFHAKLVGREG